MTGLVGVIVPVMIGVGTALGSVLRGWSQEAQAQVNEYIHVNNVLRCSY